MIPNLKRFLIALILAVLTGGFTLVIARAQQSTPVPPTTPPGRSPFSDCANCHQDIFDKWQNGLHGKSISDPVFQYSWNAQGRPDACLVCHSTGYDPQTGQPTSDGIVCSACHNPIPPNHPVDPMPINNASVLCEKCHSDPRFTVADWQTSAHYVNGMDCTTCHDPHSAGMKTIGGSSPSGDASALCENCHKDVMQNFPLSVHAQAGVTCVNCHLGFNVAGPNTAPVDFNTAHAAPDHTFLPSLDTCTKCHANQMHAPGQAVAAAAIQIEKAGGTPTPNPAPILPTPIPQASDQAPPVSPFGFAGLAALVGLGGGMVLAPWLDQAHRRITKEDNHD